MSLANDRVSECLWIDISCVNTCEYACLSELCSLCKGPPSFQDTKSLRPGIYSILGQECDAAFPSATRHRQSLALTESVREFYINGKSDVTPYTHLFVKEVALELVCNPFHSVYHSPDVSNRPLGLKYALATKASNPNTCEIVSAPVPALPVYTYDVILWLSTGRPKASCPSSWFWCHTRSFRRHFPKPRP